VTITPNTAFSDGTPLTATQANAFPRGVMAVQSLATGQNTTSTHTTFQDTGATLTFTEESGRIYRITYSSNAYPNGGLQGMKYRILRGASNIRQFEIPSGALSTANSWSFTYVIYYTSASSGSQTWKVQFGALSSNTQVNDYGASGQERLFFVEDIGAS